ncbi:MAG: hypothetical protein JWO00_548 [Candidatus Parcubacteria bacterium]|nr:hypothetical protein [Candidatus Parcubacteria bacterium]
MKHYSVKYILVLYLVFAFATIIPIQSTYAQNSDTQSNFGNSDTQSNTRTSVFYLQNPLDSKYNTIGGLISGFIDIFTYLVVIFAVLMIIYVGLRFVMARGNMTEIKERKDQLLWLMVGLAIVIGARILVSVVINTLQATGVVSPSVINNAHNGLNGQ